MYRNYWGCYQVNDRGEILNRLLEEIREEGEPIKELIDKIVDYYSRNLDELINHINEIVHTVKNKEIDEYPNDVLELQIIEIANQMYFAGRELAYLGGQSDLASAKRRKLYNEVIMHAKGTIQDKKAKAEQYTINESLMEEIFKRAYDQLKFKLEQADKIYSALKKVYTKRMMELEVFRKELSK